MHRQFGRIPSPLDRRDWDLEDFISRRRSLKLDKGVKWDFPSTALDQEETPHCVGFSMAHFGINLPTFTQYTTKDAHNLYYKCKEVDGDPTGEDGTTIRSAAKVLQDVGAIRNYAFARTMSSVRWWLQNRGPLIVGTIWTERMMVPDERGNLDVNGFVMGGHAYLVNEWREDDYIGIKNSWGPDWGNNGKAYISASDFERIFLYGGEALAAVEQENYKASNESWMVILWEEIASLIKSVWLNIFG